MSLFRQASAWGLRAIAALAAFELGAGAYGMAIDRASALAQLAGHRAAMSRLDTEAHNAETQAASAEARIETPAITHALGSPAALAAAVRDHLMNSGAEAPVVEATDTPLSGRLRRVVLAAVWREPLERSPQTLYALAQRFPGFEVERLRLERQDQVVMVDAQLLLTLAPP